MKLQERINLLSRLGEYIQSDNYEWQESKENASRENGWFIPGFIELSARNIAKTFLQKEALTVWADYYKLQTINQKPKIVGIVMAGNIGAI